MQDRKTVEIFNSTDRTMEWVLLILCCEVKRIIFHYELSGLWILGYDFVWLVYLPKRMLAAVPQSDWKRPAGRPHTSWLATIKNDLSYHNLSVEDATELALDRPLWRLLAASGATHWYGASCTTTTDDRWWFCIDSDLDHQYGTDENSQHLPWHNATHHDFFRCPLSLTVTLNNALD